MAGTVWFVGAGPGDPDLMTLKGRDLIARAGAILFAGSLVNEAATRWAPANCDIADSKDMTLEDICAWLISRSQQHETVIRLQTGDPSLYGALIEMVQPLDAAGVPVRVVPGVTSAMASAAAAVETFTLPEVTQTVILTRVAGRTPMPPGESLQELAAHRCTLCIYLSITLLHAVQSELRAAGWAEDAPIVIVHKASWPGEEKVLRATLATVKEVCREAKMVSQAMIIASPALGARHWPELAKSKLYDAAFTHRFRRGAVANANLLKKHSLSPVIPAKAGIQQQHHPMSNFESAHSIAVYMLASKRNGTLYTGVTSKLIQRIWQHKNDVVEGFSKRYNAHLLVYFEMHENMESAMTREKQIKGWKRQWKLELIEKNNPD